MRPGAVAADVGDDPRLGSVMKLVGNFHIASIIELIAEGMTLGESNGLSRDTLLQFYSFMLPGEHKRCAKIQSLVVSLIPFEPRGLRRQHISWGVSGKVEGSRVQRQRILGNHSLPLTAS